MSIALASHPLFQVVLRQLQSTAVAVISAEGHLIEASEGYWQLLPAALRQKERPVVRRFFLQPTFDDIKTAIEEAKDHYLACSFTIGDRNGASTTLHGIAYDDENLLFIGEHDLKDLTQLNNQMLLMNESINDAHRKLSSSLREIRRLEKSARHDSLTDPLTGLGNRRMMEHVIIAEWARAEREQTALALVMGDLDHFKRINDTYGHEVGDQVIKAFAQLIREGIRPFDQAIRYGGEEFMIFLPHTGAKEATALADRLRLALAQLTFPPHPFIVTASFGVTVMCEEDSSEQLLERVDAALYEAKEGGRNRVLALP